MSVRDHGDLKVVVVNPFAATASRQDFYARVQALTGWRVTLLTARVWRNDFGDLVKVRRSSLFQGGLIPLPVVLNGNIPLHMYAARVAPILSRERADITHVYHEAYGTATYQIFRAHQRRCLTPIGFSSQQNIEKRYPWPFRAMERFVYRKAAFAIVVSRQVTQVLQAKGYAGRTFVVPNAVDSSAFNIPEHSPPGPRAPLRVGFIGRLVPEKGVDTLLAAISLLQPALFRAVIAGRGPDEARLRELAARLNVEAMIEWKGYVEHDGTPDFFKAIDVLVVPSKTTQRWMEQFGRVVIEATASGVVVVASDSGELPHLIAATTGGWIFPEGNAPALADRLEWVRTHEHEVDVMRLQAHRYTLERFDEDAVAWSYAMALREAVSAQPPGAKH
jgi:L-malate glycosyltransferase